ncbi:MAG: pyridoxal phosphate-dependent aminotransferase family protein [Bacteroidales bacterium]|nr:pyridoxal phosphate-dependent aminotransferase family protein [Candidatus Liminaster caballi]
MTLLQEKLAAFTAPQEAKAKGIYPYFRAIGSDQDTEVMMNGKKVLMFGSNAYTGLTNHPRVKAAAIEMTEKYGTGCAGSRFLNGTLDIHEKLEQRLAAFVGKEEAMMYSTGFFANMGTISCLTGREDYVIWDELDHASIIEGKRLTFSQTLKFKHNDMASLEKVLRKCEPNRVKLIVVDGVFSMEGDIANLPDIVTLAKKYNASVMVDEAHSLGVFGKNGRGICDHYGLTNDVDIIMGTFSKSLASIGGFIATDSITANYLRHTARPFIFSASPTPAAVGAVNAALDILESEPERIKRLWDLTHYSLKRCNDAGFEIGNTSTPIIPLFVRDFEKTLMVTRMLLDAGIFVNPVVPPAVPSGDTLIRFSLMATHTKEQIDYAIDNIERVFRELEIIK